MGSDSPHMRAKLISVFVMHLDFEAKKLYYSKVGPLAETLITLTKFLHNKPSSHPASPPPLARRQAARNLFVSRSDDYPTTCCTFPSVCNFASVKESR